MTILGNGTIVFPKRGTPPRHVDGYDVDPNDPYVFYPQWEPCKYRYGRQYVCPSGMVKTTPSCNLLVMDITYGQCCACQLRVE